MEIAKSIAPIALAIIMFGLGLGLTISDFMKVIKNPKDFVIGFICQVILLPVIAFTLIQIISLPIEISMGVMIIAAAPGGVTSNILTKFANGDVALSVSSIATTATLPLRIVGIMDDEANSDFTAAGIPLIVRLNAHFNAPTSRFDSQTTATSTGI